MADGDRQTDGDARGKRHSRIATGCHILTLLIGSMYVLAFVLAIWTGYLSWIGIAVGASLTVPGVISPLLGLAGRKRLSTVLAEVGVGLTIPTAIVLQVSLLRAKSDRAGNWRPYRFDNVLAAMEARRAVPDAVNAACHYESVFARIDTDGFVKAVCNCYRSGLEIAFFDASWYLRYRQRLAAGISERRGTWLVLGLRRYHNAHGAWPATLEEVSPYVPAEAFRDPTTDGTFVYAREGDGFRLHGNGPDGRVTSWPPCVREPAPEPNSHEVVKMYEQIYGKERTRVMLGIDSNERR